MFLNEFRTILKTVLAKSGGGGAAPPCRRHCSQMIYRFIYFRLIQSAILFPPKHTTKVYSNLKSKTVRNGFSKWSNSDFCAYGH